MTESLNPKYDNFDDLLPAYRPFEDMGSVSADDGTLTAETIGYSSLSREVLLSKTASPIAAFSKAWGVIELGLAAPSTETRQGFLDIAEQRLDMVLDGAQAPSDIRLRAIMARAAIPSFRVRAEQAPLTEKLQFETYRRLGKLVTAEAARGTYNGKGVKCGQKGLALGLLCESLTYAMLLRSGDPALFPFPAGPREDCSTISEQNHDLYIPYKDTKIPIQVKRSHGAYTYPDVVGVNFLKHAIPAVRRSFETTEKTKRRTWTKDHNNHEVDVVLARYLDRSNAQYSRRNPAVAEQTLSVISRSIGATVREQMAAIIQAKKSSGEIS